MFWLPEGFVLYQGNWKLREMQTDNSYSLTSAKSTPVSLMSTYAKVRRKLSLALHLWFEKIFSNKKSSNFKIH